MSSFLVTAKGVVTQVPDLRWQDVANPPGV